MKKQATLWGPDAPVFDRYQKALEKQGYRVTRMGHLPNNMCWVALQVENDYGLKPLFTDDAVEAFISKPFNKDLPPNGWDDDPLDMNRARA